MSLWSAVARPASARRWAPRAPGRERCLIETAGCLGGAATLKSVQTYCGLYSISEKPRPAVLGVAAQVVQKLRAIGGAAGPLKFRGVFLVIDSEAVKLVLG